MFCPKCGESLASQTAFCPRCGASLAPAPAASVDPASIRAFRLANIMLTGVSIFSCAGLIGALFGALGIVFSAQALSALSTGNPDEAKNKAASARRMFFVGLILLIGAVCLCLIALIVYFAIFSATQGL